MNMSALVSAVNDVGTDVRVTGGAELSAALGQRARFQAFLGTLVGVLAALASVLAMAGVYGVTAYTTSRRTHEFGVRLALGASPFQLLALVLREAGGLVLSGTLLGLFVGSLVGETMRSLLFGLTPTDPRILGAVALSVFLVGMVASLVPALRASRTDPVVPLRAE